MDFPKDKNFMYAEDNEDGTITMTIRFEGEIETMVIPITFESIVTAYISGIDIGNLYEEIEDKIVIIPDNVGD